MTENGSLCVAAASAHLIEHGAAEDVDACAAVLADAFTGYPFTDWIVPESDRPRRLQGLFALTVGRVGIPYGDVWVSRCPDTSRVVGVVVAIASQAVPGEVWRSMAAQEQDLLGSRLEAASAADEAAGALRPEEPHYMIATMGVHPDHRRRGLATRLLAPALDSADIQQLTAYLETSSAANVALYSTAGFAVRDTVRLPDGGPDVWAMSRQPRTRGGGSRGVVGQRRELGA